MSRLYLAECIFRLSEHVEVYTKRAASRSPNENLSVTRSCIHCPKQTPDNKIQTTYHHRTMMWTLFNQILDKQDINVCNIATSNSEEIEVIFSSLSSDESENVESESILQSFSSSIASVDDPLESEHGERIQSPRKVPIGKVRELDVVASMHSVMIDIDILQQQQKERSAAILIQRMTRGTMSRSMHELVLENNDSDDTLDSDIDDSVVFDDDFLTCLDDDEDCQEEEEISDFMDLIDIQVGDMQDGSLHMDKISMHLRSMDFTSTTYKRNKNLVTRKKNQLPRIREDAAAEPTLHTSNHSDDNDNSDSNRCDKDIDLDLFLQDICKDIRRNTEDGPLLNHLGKKPKPQKSQQQQHHKTPETKPIEISVIEKDFLLERDVSSITISSLSVSDKSIEKSLQTNMTEPLSSSLSSSNKKWKHWNIKKKQTGRSSSMKFGRMLSLARTFSTMEGSFTTSFAPTAIRASKSKPKRLSNFWRKSTPTSSSTTTATTPLSQISERVSI
jgi:hypothetical protein